MDTLHAKHEKLKEAIGRLPSAAVAFSGGVDSTFLLLTAHEVLGDRVLAITARSLSFPQRELDEARAFITAHGIRHAVVDSEELDLAGFADNPPNRCYICKKELFGKILALAAENGISAVMEGSNADDAGDYRPGLQAVAELHVLSPLKDAGLTKQDIRQLSREMDLPTWNKQSFACLSSRFPYGERITPAKLRQIDQAEQFLLDLGFHQIRVRYHGDLARIETDETGFSLLQDRDCREKIAGRFKELGFTYTALDIRGYRTGSMNETLPAQNK
ncbi:MAG: ATP-dependent sacrificial sulfur transferase LarE [Clostridiaceae bacterium]|nr:ATP-dependent sacrificial sulfur transferase LarE [Clostridiaceae bacterium]